MCKRTHIGLPAFDHFYAKLGNAQRLALQHHPQINGMADLRIAIWLFTTRSNPGQPEAIALTSQTMKVRHKLR